MKTKATRGRRTARTTLLAAKLIGCVPMSWLDPLFTGRERVIGKPPYDCTDIQLLLTAIKNRMRITANTALRGDCPKGDK
jgi:hypothetical protein